MKLHFDCPVCATSLHLRTHESSGPCPTCQNTLEVSVKIKAHEPALTAERTVERPENLDRKVKGWKCSGVPHGTSPVKNRV